MARPSGEGPRTGEVVAGRYRIERPLGEGGMAQVFQATDLAGGAPVALKILRREVAESPEAVRRLRQEGEVLSQLKHPAIVSVSTYGQLDSGQLFLAMELLEGETLRERLQREKRLDPEALAPVVAGIVAGLEAAHGAGVVHRDLKPDNVFLSRLPGRAGFQVKVLDFGISKVTGGDRLTRTGQVLGTPRYMAPEQLAAERDLDARVDVYALGVMIYEALAGRSPFLTSSPSDLIVAIVHGKSTPLRAARPDVPAELEAVVARAMARARAARFPTARALGEAFLGLAAPARSSGPVSPASPGTVALGAHDPGAPALPPAAGSALKPGTFSAFGAPAPYPGREATSTVPGRRAARGMKTAPSTPAVTPMPHGAPPEAVAARWEEGPGVAGESWADRSPGALPAAATPAAATPTAMRLDR
ncbi:MAG: serine/threonine-protein kinase [Myxococcota bacterium]